MHQTELTIPNYHRSPSAPTSRIHVIEIPVPQKLGSRLQYEYPRVLLSSMFVILSSYTNSVVVIILNDMTLDRVHYLPLPDRILESVPYFDWAFRTGEYLILGLNVMFWIMLALHKNRLVIMRRLFIIVGVVFYLRCPCLIFTSLPVPSDHIECDPKINDTSISRLERAAVLFVQQSISLTGAKTCGDFMFSGQVVMPTLLVLFFFEYTPYVLLHIIVWLIMLSAFSFILMGKAHYMIDIVVAVYVTFLYFHYYHAVVKHHETRSILSTHRALAASRSRLTFCYSEEKSTIWIPFYRFLERSTSGADLENEFENPLRLLKNYLKKKCRKEQEDD